MLADRIREMLNRGERPADVARACDTSPNYVHKVLRRMRDRYLFLGYKLPDGILRQIRAVRSLDQVLTDSWRADAGVTNSGGVSSWQSQLSAKVATEATIVAP